MQPAQGFIVVGLSGSARLSLGMLGLDCARVPTCEGPTSSASGPHDSF